MSNNIDLTLRKKLIDVYSNYIELYWIILDYIDANVSVNIERTNRNLKKDENTKKKHN